MVKVKDLDLPPEQQASHLQRVMSLIQIIYDRYCSMLTISTILFPDADLCRSVVCWLESLSQLSSLGVFRVGCLDCGLSLAEIGPAKGMYSTFLRDLEFIFGFLSSNCYDKGTFNTSPIYPYTPPPPNTHTHTQDTDFFLLFFFVYFDGCYDPQMAKNWKLQAGQRMLHLIGQNLPTTFGECLI